ncbi:MAG TPA: glycosyltransferase family 39 protein, partial [Alloacidobacterium sp.]|nr:glycosyltransferase family 39 protein [Alloacidobacterium sp.]
MTSLDRLNTVFRTVLAAALVLLLAVFVFTTRHWPLVGDATLFRYVVFLMQHGFAPYRQIIDINMPGAYLVDWAVLHIFGSGSTAWRTFDFALLVAAGLSMIAIARKTDWLAGFIAAAVFAVLHAADGIAQTGQRDLTVAVLLLASLALFFHWMDRRQLWPIVLTGLLSGFAVTIKPTAAPFALALAVLIFVLPKQSPTSLRKPFFIATIAFLLPSFLMLAFLLREHALDAFLFIVRGLLPFHAALSHRSLGFLLAHSTAPLQIFLLPWLFLMFRSKSWRQPRTIALLAAIACGLIAYIAQGKGYPYQRYTLLGFLLLAMCMEFLAACRRSALDRTIGTLSLAGLVFLTAPIATFKAAHYDWRNQEFMTMLSSSLDQQGGAQLSGNIQCLDMTAGCIDTLYRMRLIQSTGFLYDCYFFAPGQTAATERLRDEFLDQFEKSHPAIVVLTDQYCLNGVHNFAKVENWPQFNDYFSRNYTLVAERRPPDIIKWWSRPEQPTAYRIYKRNAGN